MTFRAVPKPPSDVGEQHDLWGANCGPTALAAILGISVAEVRPLIEQAQNGTFKGYMHAGHLLNTLKLAGKSVRRIDCSYRKICWPEDQGVCLLQFDGPWCLPNANPRARFRYTHSVAAAANGALVYDGNARVWLRREDWEGKVLQSLIDDVKRCTGWYTSTVIDVW